MTHTNSKKPLGKRKLRETIEEAWYDAPSANAGFGRIEVIIEHQVKSELTQAFKELKEDAREWSVQDAELRDYQTGTELTYVPIEAIDNKIKELEETK